MGVSEAPMPWWEQAGKAGTHMTGMERPFITKDRNHAIHAARAHIG